MTTNHIDQLTEWWSEAEHAPFREGDVLIARFDDRPMPFEVYPAGCDSDAPAETVRVLSRAPKPRPAWHDAPAVTAKGREDWDHVEAFSRNDDYDPPRWIDNQGITYTAEQLSDVTPLIEAKVTDEMVKRARAESMKWEFGGISENAARAMLTAALGLETT